LATDFRDVHRPIAESNGVTNRRKRRCTIASSSKRGAPSGCQHDPPPSIRAVHVGRWTPEMLKSVVGRPRVPAGKLVVSSEGLRAPAVLQFQCGVSLPHQGGICNRVCRGKKMMIARMRGWDRGVGHVLESAFSPCLRPDRLSSPRSFPLYCKQAKCAHPTRILNGRKRRKQRKGPMAFVPSVSSCSTISFHWVAAEGRAKLSRAWISVDQRRLAFVSPKKTGTGNADRR
jgi:hypothetical protein